MRSGASQTKSNAGGRADGPNQGGGEIGPKVARLGAALALVIVLAAGLALGARALFLALGRGGPEDLRVPAGVSCAGQGRKVELGGLDRFRATGALEDVASSLTRLPVDAYVDKATKGVVPGLDGRRLDVGATVEAALAAQAGETVAFVYYVDPPAITLDDFRESPVYHGNPAKPEVAVILNVAWGDEYLDPILTLVENAGGRLTICPVGDWLDGSATRASWLAAAASRGHEIGNHGYHNREMTYDEAQIREELKRTSDLIAEATGRRSTIFAPPMGAFGQTTLRAAAADGYRTVLWSLDTIDWRREGVDVIADRVISRVGPGDIILCHPTEQTAPAFEKFLPVLAEKGLRVVTLSELISSSWTE